MGEYNRVIYYHQLSLQLKLAIVKSLKADVSSFSPSSERLDEELTLEASVLNSFMVANLRYQLS